MTLKLLFDPLTGKLFGANCQVGQRGYPSTRILRQNGFDVSNPGGGDKTYWARSPTPGYVG